MDERFMLTDLPSGEGFLVTSRIRRCRGCAQCISTNMGSCSIDDDLTPALDRAMMSELLVIRTGISDSQFSMPMRKAVERLANILQSFTDAGHNTPLDNDSVNLRRIRICVHGSQEDPRFESYARDLLEKGPVEKVNIIYTR